MCFMYISLAISFDHCTQGNTRDGGNRYGILNGFHNSIASWRITESLHLALNKKNNGLNRVTILELLGNWVLGQYYVGCFC